MSTKKIINSNNKLILLMILTAVLLVMVLALLYFTFGQNTEQSQSQSTTQTVLPSSSSTIRTVKQFEQETPTQVQEPEMNNDSVALPQISFSQSSINIDSSKFVNIPKPTSNPKVDFQLDGKDRETLGKYIDFEAVKLDSLITTKILDKNQNQILVLKTPAQNLLKKINLDFPSTFRLANEDRLPVANDRIVLYYPSQKRAAYLGEFITDIYNFKYQEQNYWLSIYMGDLIISKPDFEDWKFIDVGESKIDQIIKKTEFEFDVITKYIWEDYEEFNQIIVSPQTYIIDGIFDPVSD